MSIPSVTQVLQPFMDFSRIPAEVLEAAADRGTEVHSICARIAKKLWVVEVTEAYAGYVQSFTGWLDAMVEEVVLAEERLHDGNLGFHGMPDLICRIKGDEGLCLIDLKTPRAFSRSWWPQIAGYRHLAIKAGHKIDRVASLQLHPDGGKAKFTESTKSLTRDFAVFLAALSCWRYFNGD